MREYKNYEFSDDDYKLANLLFENEKAGYSYLATCSGHLWKYDITADEVTLVSSDIPFDENDPYIKIRKGKEGNWGSRSRENAGILFLCWLFQL